MTSTLELDPEKIAEDEDRIVKQMQNLSPGSRITHGKVYRALRLVLDEKRALESAVEGLNSEEAGPAGELLASQRLLSAARRVISEQNSLLDRSINALACEHPRGSSDRPCASCDLRVEIEDFFVKCNFNP